MPRTVAIALLLALLPLATLSCKNTDQQSAEQTRLQNLAVLQPISYHRVGGPGKVDEKLTVFPTGEAQASSTFYGTGKATLSEFQLLQLVRMFENWDQFTDNYPPAGSTFADPPAIAEIIYGSRKITLADNAENVPDSLLRIRSRMQELIKEVTGH
jgi:hypothetical protein